MAKQISIKRLKKIGNWCYYQGTPNKKGGIDKCPFNPNTKRRARNSDVSSFGSFELAKQRAKEYAKTNPKSSPGVGLHIGPLNDEYALIGVDLDGCIDLASGEVSAEARTAIEKFASYSEVSPSGTGIKIFALAKLQTLEKLRSKTDIKHKKEFKRSSHDGLELHLSNSYFTVTFDKFKNKFLSEIPFADLLWLVNDHGPRISRPTNTSSSEQDKSGSGYGFRFAIKCVRNGNSFEAFLDKIADEGGDAADWAGRVDERQLKRAYENAETIIEERAEELLQLFPEHVEEITDGWRPAPTEVCASELFAKEHCDKFRYNSSGGNWYHWTGWRWSKGNEHAVDQAIIQVCKQLDKSLEKGAKPLLKRNAVQGIKKLAATHPALVTTAEMWDSDENLLLTPAGLVDLRTGQVRPSRPSNLISRATAIAPVKFEKFRMKNDCPRFRKFVQFICNNDAETIRFLQMWFGYCLTAQIKEQKFLFIHGCGGSGKSTLANILAKIAGDYAIQIDTDVLALSQQTRHATSIARMRGARIVIASETKENRKWDQQLLKQLTGGDPIVARFMRQDEFQFEPRLKLTIIGNKRPSMTTVESAMKRRMLVLEISRTPKTPDPDLFESLIEELPGILAWAIEGAVKWHKTELQIPRTISADTEEYFADNDIFQQWFDAKCEPDPSGKESFEDLWESMRSFCEKKGHNNFSENDFTDALKDQKYQRVRNVGPKRARGYKGLKLLPIQNNCDPNEEFD